ncbi:unnamed protein product [Bursaphelenchus okinawaensis]|uniref:HMG box domain-containing protein n=1 Tax=Bursaphelenchus okinawaensis TaxID=465554 RepID=A0A811L791_9BILA|nr:unnamed protein product [Bursaphelenchus okinawaensis]CAG9119600.1 unnamed protein product [Bursaphelenchus okinawaensis]
MSGRTRAKSQKLKDSNAPKKPCNAYAIFYQHYTEQFFKKNPGNNIDRRFLTQQISKAWRGLTEDEKQPFQEKAAKDKQRYLNEMEVYKNSEGYKKFVKKQESKLPDIPIFSKEFLKHNKDRDTDLRQIRKEIQLLEAKASPIVENINTTLKELDALHHSTQEHEILEKEKLMGAWTRKLIPELERAGLLEELDINYNTSPEDFIETLSSSYSNDMLNKLKGAFDKFYLPLSAD